MAAPPGGTTQPDLYLSADSGVYNDLGVTLATNGQTVEQWNDLSTNARNATQSGTSTTRPIYNTNRLNGLPSVTFAAGNSTFLNSAYSGDVKTAIVVFVCPSAGAPNFQGLIGAKTAAGVAAYNLYAYEAPSANQRIHFARGTAGDGGGQPTNFRTFEQMVLDCPCIVWGTQDGTTIKIGRNEQNFGTATNAGGAVQAPTNPVIGAAGNATTDFLTGDIYAVALYGVLLSNTELQSIIKALMQKWGLTYGNPYLMATFDNNDPSLYLMTSSDGITWTYKATNYIDPTGTILYNVRDPAIAYPHNSGLGNYSLVHTAASGASANETFFWWGYSNDGQNWTKGGVVDCSALAMPGGLTLNKCWSPQFIMNSDNTVYEDIVGGLPTPHVFFMASSDGSTNGIFFEVHPTARDWSTWSVPVQVTGAFNLGSAGTPHQPFMFDPFPLYFPAEGKFRLFFGDDTISPESMSWAESTTMLSGYTIIQSQILGTSQAYEAPGIVKLTTGTWFMLGDKLGAGLNYATSTNFPASEGSTTWSLPAAVNGPGTFTLTSPGFLFPAFGVAPGNIRAHA